MLPNWLLFIRLWQRMKRHSLAWIALVSLGLVLLGAVGFSILEEHPLQDSCWWAVVTVTTVGYGDLFPQTAGGRLVGVGLMVLGIGLLGGFTAGLATQIIEYRSKRDRGVKQLRERGHVLVCGWHETRIELVKNILADRRPRPIVVIADLPETPFDREDVGFVHGEVDENTLELANVREAEAAVILGNQTIEDVHGRDAKTLITALMVKECNPRIYTVIELYDASSLKHASVSRADEVIVVGSLSVGLLSRAVLDHGSSRAISNLVWTQERCEIYRVSLPSGWEGRSFKDSLERAKTEMDMLLVAVEPAGGELILNPPGDYVFKKGDMVAVIAEERPEFSPS